MAENMSSKELTPGEIQVAMGTMNGTRYLLWCALKQNHDVKLEKMGDLVDLDNIDEMNKIIEDLGGEAARKAKNLARRKAR